MTLEINPLTDVIRKRIIDNNNNIFHPHIVKRVKSIKHIKSDNGVNIPKLKPKLSHLIKRRDAIVTKPTMEIAFFVDETYYSKFSKIFDNDRKEVRKMLEAYLNGVQAIFHNPTIETPMDIIITEIYFMKKKSKFLGHIPKMTQLLPKFCEFQEQINFPNDTHPKYWDIAILLTGIKFTDMIVPVDDERVGGQANTDAICTSKACVIVNFDLHATYVIAHEIGHV